MVEECLPVNKSYILGIFIQQNQDNGNIFQYHTKQLIYNVIVLSRVQILFYICISSKMFLRTLFA